jgi:hypothetical protein CLOST_1905
MQYYRRIMGKVRYIKINKWTNSVIYFVFRQNFDNYNAVSHNIMTTLLVDTSLKYPDKRSTKFKLEELYNAKLHTESDIYHNSLVTTISIDSLSDKYSEEGNVLNSVKYLIDIIYKHNLNDQKLFNNLVSLLKDEYNSNMCDSNFYAYVNFIMGLSDPLAKKYFKYNYENIKNIGINDILDSYKNMINSLTDIVIVGDVGDEVLELVKNIPLNNNIKYNSFDIKYYPYKKSVDKFNCSASFTKILYKIKDFNREKDHVFLVYQYILGGSPNSILFDVIREKNSLCYSINAYIKPVISSMIVSSKINRNNYLKYRELLDDIINNFSKYITLEMLENSKEYFKNIYNNYQDSHDNIYVEELKNIIYGNSIEDRILLIDNITIDDVIAFSKRIILEDEYYLEGVGNEEV